MDTGASVIAKLKNKAQTSGMSFQIHLRLFCQEEFLRRLSLSKYVDNLILKGGLFLFVLSGFESRATIDVDFLLRQIPGSVEDARRIVSEIINTPSGNDFITFEMSSFEEITPQRKYKGVSFQLIGKFSEVTGLLNIFLGGIWNAIVNEDEWLKNWSCQTTSW